MFVLERNEWDITVFCKEVKKMNVKRAMLVCVLAGMVLSVSCAPSIVTTDSGVYQHGRLYALSSKDMTAVHKAAVKAMEKFELKVIDEQKDVFYAKVTAKSADGKTVKVKIKPEGEKTSFTAEMARRPLRQHHNSRRNGPKSAAALRTEQHRHRRRRTR